MDGEDEGEDAEASTGAPSTGTQAALLMQALQSGDNTLLAEVLGQNDRATIDRTVRVCAPRTRRCLPSLRTAPLPAAHPTQTHFIMAGLHFACRSSLCAQIKVEKHLT